MQLILKFQANIWPEFVCTKYMKRNCESEAVDVIGLARTANETYLELQAKYEGKQFPPCSLVYIL